MEGAGAELDLRRLAEATLEFRVSDPGAFAEELRFLVPRNAELLLDDLLLFEP